MPIKNIARLTTTGEKNLKELNGQINFFTTAGFAGTAEYKRCVQMAKDMAELKGQFVFGSDWHMPVHFGLYGKKEVLDAKNDQGSSAIAFMMNYMSIWAGVTQGGLINIDDVQSLRDESLKPILDNKNGQHEIYISMDVARSEKDSNNRTVFVVFNVNRSTGGIITSVDVVNIICPPNGLTFLEQTIIMKQLQSKYNARKCIYDDNGVGKGVRDFLILVNEDFNTRKIYPSWRVENIPELQSQETFAQPIAYAFNASTYNTDAILNLWDFISSGRLRFLVSARNLIEENGLDDKSRVEWYNAYMQTDTLIDEMSNLKIKEQKDGNVNMKKIVIDRISKKIDKDRYSALIMGLWYIQNQVNLKVNAKKSYKDMFFCN